MICRKCAQRLARRDASIVTSRTFAQTTSQRAQAVTAQTTTATNPRPNDRPAATSTSAAQPFSTPLTPSPDSLNLPINKDVDKSKQPLKIQSSVPAGTILKGLNFMKNKQDPVALEDSEYPPWLWTVLNKSGAAESGQGQDAEGDLFSKSKKQRRIAAKALKRKQLLDPESLAEKVPIYEQSIDLPSDPKEGLQAREQLTKAMRVRRRSKIKEDNFLKEMS
ncbi:hypothetical protein DOTSEDRAFT_121327 [Dothistroma septosporum NZE10]|uniref:Large ribosomal subunit protein mL54 n=1 Tax=Dothistroma septosporum (strain NZE10 / CBS 128990) TaxID=675120 RepID=N1Q313_DOTSN|nr:hypothetical protein DOTSEDRAFT_121327 [Dothistroma septosporum NZE10]